MKRVYKGPVPNALQGFVLRSPGATWEQMSGDNTHGGGHAAHECRDQAIGDQKGLCAYCEQRISSDDPLHRRIEHFHPKSDRTGTHNWSLDWQNMLAVCDGGSCSSKEEQKSHPLPANLSCDAHKDYMIQTKKLPVACEGHLLNPLTIPAFPNIFKLDKGTGYLSPDNQSCDEAYIGGNSFETTRELVGNTIAMLNINCNRLAERRRCLIHDIERNKKRLRQKGYAPAEAPEKLTDRYFGSQWPEFFTTLRCCLGSAAEDYLQSIDYRG